MSCAPPPAQLQPSRSKSRHSSHANDTEHVEIGQANHDLPNLASVNDHKGSPSDVVRNHQIRRPPLPDNDRSDHRMATHQRARRTFRRLDRATRSQRPRVPAAASAPTSPGQPHDPRKRQLFQESVVGERKRGGPAGVAVRLVAAPYRDRRCGPSIPATPTRTPERPDDINASPHKHTRDRCPTPLHDSPRHRDRWHRPGSQGSGPGSCRRRERRLSWRGSATTLTTGRGRGPSVGR